MAGSKKPKNCHFPAFFFRFLGYEAPIAIYE
jgi:hypothetical protein